MGEGERRATLDQRQKTLPVLMGALEKARPELFGTADLMDRFTEALARDCASPQDVYRVCLGRDIDVDGEYAFARQPLTTIARTLLESEEFRIDITRRLAEAFPDRDRRFFCHVPKTAGTSVIEALRSIPSSALWWSEPLDPRVANTAELIMSLRTTWNDLTNGAEHLWFAGHTPLGTWQRDGLLSHGSFAFTVVRHPVEVQLSQARYIIERIQQDPLRSTSLQWSSWLHGMNLAPAATAALAGRTIIRSPQFRAEYGGIFCRYLGDGSPEPAKALETLRGTGCATVELSELPAFLASLGCAPLEHRNASARGGIRYADLASDERATITQDLSSQDLTLFMLSGHTIQAPDHGSRTGAQADAHVSLSDRAVLHAP